MTTIAYIILAAITITTIQRSRRFWARGLPPPDTPPPNLADFSRTPGESPDRTPDDPETLTP